MGEFAYIVVKDLEFKDDAFSQTTVYFSTKGFVSWEPTTESPKSSNEEWHWLAGNTFRVKKKRGREDVTPEAVYGTQSIREDSLEYEQSWSPEDGKKTLIHLALPPNFVVNIPSLDGHIPFYVKFDRGRVCLDWILTSNDPPHFSFELVKCDGQEFNEKATEFVRAIRPLADQKKHEVYSEGEYEDLGNKNELRGLVQARPGYERWDVFISHASEDKEAIARPLADALKTRGLKVWYDEFSLTVGDSLRRSIDRGLSSSRYGVVVLSPHFFEKHWPQQELNGLATREVDGKKVILPVWHQVNFEEVRRHSPTLADKIAVSSEYGIEPVVEKLVAAMSLDIKRSSDTLGDESSRAPVEAGARYESKLVNNREEAQSTLEAPGPQKLKRPWTRDQVIAVIGVLVAALAVIVAVSTPEIRQWIGLEKKPESSRTASIVREIPSQWKLLQVVGVGAGPTHPIVRWKYNWRDVLWTGTSDAFLCGAIEDEGGRGSIGRGVLLHTTDNGQSWLDIHKTNIHSGQGKFSPSTGFGAYNWTEVGPINAMVAYPADLETMRPHLQLILATSSGIYSTPDEGKSWSRITPPPDDPEGQGLVLFRDIYGIEALAELYAVGWQGIAHGVREARGWKWTLEQSSYSYNLDGVWALGSANRSVWAVGRQQVDELGHQGPDSHGAIYNLECSGQACAQENRPWQKLDLSAIKFDAPNQSLTSGVLIANGSAETGYDVFAIGQQGMMLKGFRNGRKAWEWHRVGLPLKNDLNSVAYVKGTLWVVGSDGIVLSSTDQGKTWSKTTVEGEAHSHPNLRRIRDAGDHGLWIVGDGVIFNLPSEAVQIQ